MSDPVTGATISVEEGNGYAFRPRPGEQSRELTFTWSADALPSDGDHSEWSFGRISAAAPTFEYTIPGNIGGACDVSVAMYDIRGRRIATLLKSPRHPGRYRVVWQTKQGAPYPAATGTYIARIAAGSFSKSIRVNLTR